ncbi:MAG: UDP-diphospho-muramoylpentapeptide beta-N-acetylglucosaminyltransferase [Bacillales bacterium]|jgi:UDP-N-acetylglucosamine--N-acetylmuramyl-(pentapeptide) pyrophosphoryl-undecaprenol N-acetylglucosamine transferase|nr:UDP-diphospho-muramoylpentapeptide beta-N-acetylglucosaminyltransferase [Bacillales bacterium]
MKLLVTGGGTGGHIYPALALIRELKKIENSLEVLYIGTENGLESKIVRNEGLPFKTIEISGFKRSISFENVKTITRFIKAYNKSRKYIKEFKPDIVIGTGGYVSGPVVFAASRLGIPTIIHEQNSVPGITNVFLSKFCTKVALSFEESVSFFPKGKTIFTGNPRATEVINFASNPNKKMFGLNKEQHAVVIVGGSRGAKPINDATIELIRNHRNFNFDLIYITGDVHYKKVIDSLSDIVIPTNVKILPYESRMPELLAASELVVARAGATTLAELTALGIPSILIPSPYVTNNHQEKNARVLEDGGAAIVRLEKEVTGDILFKDISNVLSDEEKLVHMQESAYIMGIRDSVDRFYNLINELIVK